MLETSMISFVCALLAVPFLLFAATTDIALRVVPNFVCLTLAVDGLIGRGVGYTLPISLLAMSCVFVPAVVCWRHGLMGGADAKLLAAVSLLVPAGTVPSLVLAIAMSGGVLAACYWALKRFTAFPKTVPCRQAFFRVLRAEQYRIHRGFSIPYATAIASGTLFIFAREFAV